MGDTLDFPAFPGQPELDGMDRAQLLSCLERIQLVLEQLDELEPEDMDSDAYEDWGERHEALEDLADELQDRLAELYVSDPRFTAYYDRAVPGCSRFLRDAVACWAERL